MVAGGSMVLNRNPVDFHAEIEQAAFGTGFLSMEWISRTIKCCKGVPFLTLIRSAIDRCELSKIACKRTESTCSHESASRSNGYP